MAVQTYLKQSKKNLGSKYQDVAKQLEATYGLIQEKVNKSFYKETIETDLLRSNLNNLFNNSMKTVDKTVDSSNTEPILIKPSTRDLENSYNENFDWTRGRLAGQVIQIVVRKGQVIEKIFLTKKGNRVSVKRSELGLIARLSLNN